MTRTLVALLACAALQAGTLQADDAPPPAKAALEKAQALFKAYTDGEGRFDPAVADLYARRGRHQEQAHVPGRTGS